MKKLQLLAVGLAAFMFVACSDDEGGDGGGNPDVKKLPSKIETTSKDGNNTYKYTTTFTYDSQNRITSLDKVEEYGTGNYTQKITISYTESGDVNELAYQYDGEPITNREHFAYNGNTIIYKPSYGGEISTTDSTILTINNNKQLVESKNNSYKEITKYAYDSKGNLTVEDEYYDNKLDDKYEYGYDNRNGVAVCINAPSWFKVELVGDLALSLINNATTMKNTEYDEDGNIDDTESGTMTYSYDEDGYPTSGTDNRGGTIKITYVPAK